MTERTKQSSTLLNYKGIHSSDIIIVCGCGNSLREFTPDSRVVTIGVNDVGRHFTPDYLVVLNPKNQFKGDRFNYVANSSAKAIFTQLSLPIQHPNIVPITLGKRGGTDISDAQGLPFTRNSPYVALCLAMYMGAKRIGLIGVDFTDHHFFQKSGAHPLANTLEKINREYAALMAVAAEQGIEIVNLSQESRLTAFPKVSISTLLDDSMHKCGPKSRVDAKVLSIVSYATTPVAGVPEILSRCINDYTPHRCRCVWASNDYGNKVKFPTDVEWKQRPGEARALIAAADLVIVHNGKVAPEHQQLIASKPNITMAHNYLWNVDQTLVKRGYPGVVVGQYQATLEEFKGWSIVPNPLPCPPEKSRLEKSRQQVTICYTPSGQHDVYPKSHRLYWHSKGYATTMAILKRLEKQYSIKLEVIDKAQLPHEQVLAMKARSHIVIDECVTGSYHRNSLEGLMHGCIVVNGIGLLPGVSEAFRKCMTDTGAIEKETKTEFGIETASKSKAGTATDTDNIGNLDTQENAEIPFVSASLDDLEAKLIALVNLGPTELLERGERNREWMLRHWHFKAQWYQLWLPVVEQAMDHHQSGAQPKGTYGVTQTPSTAKPEKASAKTLSTHNNLCSKSKNSKVSPKRSPVAKPSSHNSKLPVYWTCRQGTRGNFGDMLSPVVVTGLSGTACYFRHQSPRLFAVGSLIKFAKPGDVVWGTGFISSKDTCAKGVDIKAVRGPLTRDLIMAQGVDCPPVYGDPALLLPFFYPRSQSSQGRVGIIPHYVDHQAAVSALALQDCLIIDIRAGIETVLKQLWQCEVILSSSLHGCIAAEAYGIPAAWVDMSSKVVGEGFKFRDYYASTNRAPVWVNWREACDIEWAIKVALAAPRPSLDLTPLIDSFPYPGAAAKKIRQQYNAHRQLTVHKVKQARVGNSFARLDTSFTQPEGLDTRVNCVEGDDAKASGTKNIIEKQSKIAIFGTATENYAEYLLASLRSFKHKNGDGRFGYFILGRKFSAKIRRLIRQYGIQYIDVDLRHEFRGLSRQRYPSECFWIFKGPELFLPMGYDYSLAIDGDTYCNRPLELDWLEQMSHFAGIDRGCTVGGFLANLRQLKPLARSFTFDHGALARRATNTGVVFFNNDNLTDCDFFRKMVQVFSRSEQSGVPRGGDDSTFALYLSQYKDEKLHVLDDAWNLYKGMFAALCDDVVRNREEQAFVFHLMSMKPWKPHAHYPNSLIKKVCDRWNDFWPATQNQRRIEYFQRFKDKQSRTTSAGTARYAPMEIYWYRGRTPNMGDEIAPYLLAKMTGMPMLSSPIKDPSTSRRSVLLSVGSILRLCDQNTVVWGSGIRNIDQPVKPAQQFAAVRGPLTRRRLLQLGYSCPEVYGDPALLLPHYYSPQQTKRYRLGVIPHLVDQEFFKTLIKPSDEVLVINVGTKNIEQVVRQILSCECTVSTSLHGLILSVAYGIPTRWAKCSDKIMGDDTKFYDFFASLDGDLCHHLDYSNVKILSSVSSFDPFRPLQLAPANLDINALIAATTHIPQTLPLEPLTQAFPMAAPRVFRSTAG